MADLTGTSYTGTTWQGNYGPNGQLYYYGGKAFNSPQELYAALGQPYDASVLPYGTTIYGPGYNSGMSPWDASVRNNPLGYLDQPSGGTASLYANASTPMTTPTTAQTTTTPTTSMDATAYGGQTTGTGTTTPTPSTYAAPATASTGTTTMPSTSRDAATTGAATTGANTAVTSTTGTTTGTGTVNPPQGNYIPGEGSTTPVEPFNPVDDPRASVYRALLANGFNPDVPTWGMNQLQKRAADLVMSALGRSAWGGNPNTLTTPGEFQNYINSLVGQSGKMGIMPTAAQGKDYLNSINTLMNGTARSEGATYLSSLFGADPEQSAAAYSSLMYGGLAPSVRSALAAPLANYGTRLKMYAETPEGFGVARDKNTLDILLNNLIPGYRPLFG